ncbi:plasmid partitioning protein RepB [Rhodobacteraceae bacterium]|nr:plasmid partitioning protein RepB [Paracoccaceae bacterium]
MTKKRKSIVSSFGDFTSQSTEPVAHNEPAKKPELSKQAGRVGAGIIGATKRSLTDLREERDQLLASVKDGEIVLTLDPNLIDPSPFTDRLPDDDRDGFEEFKTLLAEEGQIVPITVRRHPDDGNRYQIVYGHRRCRALSELGQNAKAILRDYSDRELAVAQGIENASRQDLSWIEKAVFAATMEKAGLKAKDIRSALSVDDAQLSKFRTVFNTLGQELIELIGRAPKIGRPRWLDLIGLLKNKSDHAKLRKTLSSDKVLSLSSDDRFMSAIASLSAETTDRPAKQKPMVKPFGEVGEVKFSEREVRISIRGSHASSFSTFMESEIDGLLKRFKQTIDDE